MWCVIGVIGYLVCPATEMPDLPAELLAAGPTQTTQEDSGAGQRRDDGRSNQRDSQAMPLAVKLLNADKSNAETAQEAEAVREKAKLDVWVGTWTVGLTLALVFATMLQFGALIYQGFWLRRSVRVAERALTELERPYLFVSTGRSTLHNVINDPPGTHLTPQVAVQIRNFGRTPAIIERLGARLRLSTDADGLFISDSFGVVLGPGDHHSELCIYRMAIPEQTIAELGLDSVTFRLDFSIEYRDVSGRPHETAANWTYFAAFAEFHPSDGQPRYHTLT